MLIGNKLSETPQVETVSPATRVHLLLTLGIWHRVLHARCCTTGLCEFTEIQILLFVYIRLFVIKLYFYQQ